MTPITSSVPSTSTTTPTSSVASALNNNTEIASNFTTFLQLLTTQLQNQDPLSPMDTNQFTQQLVEFASVEQQMKSNDSLTTLVSLEQAAQSTQALALVGATVVVDGSTTQLTNGKANWSLNVTKPATATVTIKDATGQTAYTSTFGVNPGTQNFTWDGHDTNGTLWPDGAVRPQGAVSVVAVPGEILSARIDAEGTGIGGLAGRVLDGDSRGRRLCDVEAPIGFAIGELRGGAIDHHGGADQGERLRRLRGLFQRYQGGEGVIRLHLLLDRCEFDQLLGELVGIHRTEWILVL